MQEKEFYINSNRYKLFSVLYKPDKNILSIPINTYIICHPFAEEKRNSQKILVEIARKLCKIGCYVLIFDMRGCGDSDGEFANSNISIWIEDLHNAISILKKEINLNKFGLIGLRLGAYIALSVNNKEPLINRLILIEPVLDPYQYFYRILRQKSIKGLIKKGKIITRRRDLLNSLNENISIDIDGYEINSTFYQDLLKQKFNYNMFAEYKGDICLLNISCRNKLPKDYQLFVQNVERMNKDIYYKIISMEPFWYQAEIPYFADLSGEILKICLT